MAIQDWLNANVLGSGTVSDFAGAGVDAWDTYQQSQAAQEANEAILEGYDQGIGAVQTLGTESKDIFKDIYDTGRGDIEPYLGAGTTALDQYMGLMSDPSTIMDDPGAQFRLQQGEEAVKRSLEQAGYADPMGSGANPAWLTEYGQNYATQELDTALNRRKPIMDLGSQATRTGAMMGDTYSQGTARVNETMSRNLAALYEGRADSQSTKYLIDSQAATAYLTGAKGLFDQVAGNPTFLEMVKASLTGGPDGGPAQTSDGTSVWDMIKDSFNIGEGEESGVIDQLNNMFGEVDWDNAYDTAGNIDWGGMFTPDIVGGLEDIFSGIGDATAGYDFGDIASGTADFFNYEDPLSLGSYLQDNATDFWSSPAEDIDFDAVFDTGGTDESWFGNFFESTGDWLSDVGSGIADFFL
jgi:hypothetical protein